MKAINKTDKIVNSYKAINSLNILLIFGSIVLIIPFSGIISIFLFSKMHFGFILVLLSICIAWTINSLNIPAYVMNLGTGNLKWNMLSHIIIGALNVIGCILIGQLYNNGYLIVLTWNFALVVGSMTLIVDYHKRNELSLNLFLKKPFFLLSLIYLILIGLSFLLIRSNLSLPALVLMQVLAVILYYIVSLYFIKFNDTNILTILKNNYSAYRKTS